MPYQDGTKVRIDNSKLLEHGVTGTVEYYDAVTQWYWVELDQGPPWRGNYEHEELRVEVE